MTDSSNLTRILKEVQPDEVYNLGAMSHVAVSFDSPEYTADVDAIGTLRLLEAIRFLGLEKRPVFIRRPPLSCTVWYRKSHRKRARRSIRVHRMPLPSCTPTGSPSTTASLTGCMPVTAFCSTTNLRAAAKPLSLAKLPGRSPTSLRGWSLACTGQHGFTARLGACQRLRQDAVDDAAAG